MPPAVYDKVVALAEQAPDAGPRQSGMAQILRIIVCKYFGHDPDDSSAGQGRTARELIERRNVESNQTLRERNQAIARRRARELYEQQYPKSEPRRKKDSK